MLHQDKKRWKQVKHYWFDIVQPSRPCLRWKFFTISCKNHNLIFYVTGKVENFHGMNCFFLHCHPISYFIIHVCNQKTDKHSEMTKSWNFQTSAYQRLKSNFRVLLQFLLGLMSCNISVVATSISLILKLRTDSVTPRIRKFWKQVNSHIDLTWMYRTNQVQTWWTCELVIWGDWRNDTTQFMSGVKELALLLWHLHWAQLNRFLVQALVECLGICMATWSKILELGQIYAWYLSRWNFFYRWCDRQFTNSGVFGFSCKNDITKSYFLCDRKSWKFSWNENCFFLHCHPISYFIIHVCNQKTDKLKLLVVKPWPNPLKFSNFRIHIRGWSQILEF